MDKINVPDTVGTISPPAMEYLIKELMTVTKVPIAVHCHDDFGLAVANSMAAVRQGAQQVHVTINGLGERAGNAALEETVLALMAFYNIETSIDTRKIGPTSRLVSRLTGVAIPGNKAIVGNNAFAHESGIHVHGVLGDPSTYEAFGPELVGVQRNIVIGKHSGAHSVKDKLEEYGVELTDEQIATGRGQGQEARRQRQGRRRRRAGGAGVSHRRAAGGPQCQAEGVRGVHWHPHHSDRGGLDRGERGEEDRDIRRHRAGGRGHQRHQGR